ncbi:unnamed protein product, partial [Sphacelaria rigidula]
MHDFSLAQVLKTHGTPVAMIDYIAAHGFCMTESMRYKREQYFVKLRLDKHLLALALRAAAISWDNCDFRCAVAATCVAVETPCGDLSLVRDHRKQDQLVAADVTMGPHWHMDGEQWDKYLSVFDEAAFRCAVGRIAGGGGSIDTCLELELRQAIPTMQREPQVFKYLFMQLGSTKSWADSKAAIDRIADIRRVGERGAPAACMVAGDEETFRFMYHLIRSNPREYQWLRIYMGDWHLLYHMVKAIMKRFWGAGIEYVAEALGLDGRKSSEASNYRVVHHTICVFFEAMWDKIVAMYYSEPDKVKIHARKEDIPAIRAWVRARAENHKSFRVWESFVLHYYPAYMAFRTGLRTGNFLLRLAGLRRMADIFCVTGKDRYQWLVVLHLMHMAQMPESDLKIVEQLFSVTLRDNRSWARVGLDERQEMANRFFKKLVNKKIPTAVEKLAPIAECRDAAEQEVKKQLFFGEGAGRNPARELYLKREPHVTKAYHKLHGAPAFTPAGKEVLHALDGRVVSGPQAAAVLSCCEVSQKKLQDNIACYVLGDKTKKGATKQKVYTIPSRNGAMKPTNPQGRSSALKSNTKNNTIYTQELLTALRGIVGAPNISQEEKERVLLKLGASVPFSLLNSKGGESRHSNKSLAVQWIRSVCPDAEQPEPYYMAHGHAVDYAVEAHREPPQTVTEDGYPAVEAYHAAKVRAEWTNDKTELLVLAHDDPDMVGIIKAPEQRGRTEKI